MSGGSYDYFYMKLQDVACDIRTFGDCSCASPALRKAFAAHLLLVSKAMKAIEWNDSGDGTGGWDETEEQLVRACLPVDAELRQAIEDAEKAREQLGIAIRTAKEPT
jgi:hypothetical protein